MGRHDAFSQDEKEAAVEYVCEKIALEKRSVLNILQKDEPEGLRLPSYPSWSRWMDESETFAMRLARAREAAFEALIEEMVEIADGDGDHNDKRVRIIAREKVATMILPRRFGMQRMDITSGGKELPAAEVPARLDRIEALIALAAARARGHALPAPEPIDITPEAPDISDVMS